MRLNLVMIVVVVIVAFSCVPMKKYKDVVEKAKVYEEELAGFKEKAIHFENKSNDLETSYHLIKEEVDKIKKDTVAITEKMRSLTIQYQKMVDQNMQLEKRLEADRATVAKSAGKMQADMDAKNLELHRKQEVLTELEDELKQKQLLLAEREKRVTELEEMMQRKDETVRVLNNKVSDALLGYKNRGLTVQERNGKIYVSLDAKLLFKTGSTLVEPEGRKAILDLTKVLENEKELEIIVEGHTDSDKMLSSIHPKNNWELSVLRATSVVDIMTSNMQVNPTILMAAGRSEFHPIDLNDKSKNRRIEIVISPNLNPLFELISK